MSNKITDETRARLGRGNDFGPDFDSWIHGRDFNSQGTTESLSDYKTGQRLYFLSQSEVLLYYTLRFDDSVENVYSQVPLDNEETQKIAADLNVKHPYSATHVMTTDLVALHKDSSIIAYSVKASAYEFTRRRTAEKIQIERKYWENHGAVLKLIGRDRDIDEIYAGNIRFFSSFWDITRVFDKTSFTKYLIIHHMISFDMHSPHIDMRTIMKSFEKEIDAKWQKYLKEQQSLSQRS